MFCALKDTLQSLKSPCFYQILNYFSILVRRNTEY